MFPHGLCLSLFLFAVTLYAKVAPTQISIRILRNYSRKWKKFLTPVVLDYFLWNFMQICPVDWLIYSDLLRLWSSAMYRTGLQYICNLNKWNLWPNGIVIRFQCLVCSSLHCSVVCAWVCVCAVVVEDGQQLELALFVYNDGIALECSDWQQWILLVDHFVVLIIGWGYFVDHRQPPVPGVVLVARKKGVRSRRFYKMSEFWFWKGWINQVESK